MSIGNVKPVGDMPEGSIVCNVEEVCFCSCPASTGAGSLELDLFIALSSKAPGCALMPDVSCHCHALLASVLCMAAVALVVPCNVSKLCRVYLQLCSYAHQASSSTWTLRILQKAGDRGSLARASGDYVIVVAHNPDAGITRVKLPSGAKKVCSCAVDLTAGCTAQGKFNVAKSRNQDCSRQQHRL